MLEGGLTQRQVATALGVNQTVICRAWNRYQTQGDASRRHAGGRQRVMSQRDERFLRIQARRHPFATATQLRSELMNATGLNVSTQTVRNRLHNTGLRARKPCIRIPLSRDHRQHRYNWAQEHVNWPLRDWQSILFTDESRYCLDFTDRRAKVWREPGERYYDSKICEHDRYGGGSIMVWGGISWEGKTDLHVFQNGTITGERYINEILDVYVKPYAGAVGENFILMDDNARPHRSRAVERYLERETIERLNWPARSPDANPIEHVWHMLQTAVSHRNPQPRTLQELGIALREEWDNLPQRSVKTLILSMGNRCRAIIHARGGHTRY